MVALAVALSPQTQTKSRKQCGGGGGGGGAGRFSFHLAISTAPAGNIFNSKVPNVKRGYGAAARFPNNGLGNGSRTSAFAAMTNHRTRSGSGATRRRGQRPGRYHIQASVIVGVFGSCGVFEEGGELPQWENLLQVTGCCFYSSIMVEYRALPVHVSHLFGLVPLIRNLNASISKLN